MPASFVLLATLLLAASVQNLFAIQIHTGETLQGSIDLPNAQQVYTFDARAGDTVQIRMTSTSTNSFTCRPELKAPSGASAGSALSSQGAEITSLLNENGTYTLLAHEFSTRTGTFNVSMVLLNGQPLSPSEPDLGAIHNGQTLLGNISLPGDLDAATFYAVAGDVVQIRMTGIGPDDFDAAPELYTPLGKKLGSGLSFSAAEITATITNTGIHTIVCKAFQTRTGPYSVSFVRMGDYPQSGLDTDLRVLRSGVTNTATIDVPGDIDAGRFFAVAGDHALIRMRRATSSSFTSTIELYSPSGVKMTNTFSSGIAEINADLTETGVYTVIAKEFSTGVNRYTLSFDLTGGNTLADIDGDGISNDDELADGTNPFDANSKFMIGSQLSPARDKILLNFPSRGQSRYRIQFRDDITAPFQDLVRPESDERELSVPDGAIATKQIELPADMAHRFFRISVID